MRQIKGGHERQRGRALFFAVQMGNKMGGMGHKTEKRVELRLEELRSARNYAVRLKRARTLNDVELVKSKAGKLRDKVLRYRLLRRSCVAQVKMLRLLLVRAERRKNS